MDKFSKIKDDEKKFEPKADIEILNYEGKNIIAQKDSIIILPYLVDEGFILMSSDSVPSFKYGLKNNIQYKNSKTFLTALTMPYNVAEPIHNAIRRYLYEYCGLVLISTFDIEVSKPVFYNNASSGKVYTCILMLRYNDYRQTTPKIVDNPDRKVIKVDLGYIDDLIILDLPTESILNKLRMELPKKK